MISRRLLALGLLCLMFFSTLPEISNQAAASPLSLFSSEKQPKPASKAPDAKLQTTPGTITYANREIATLRMTLAGAAPEIRAERAERILNSLERAELELPIDQLPLKIGNIDAIAIRLGDRILFLLGPEDVGAVPGLTLKDVADRSERHLRNAIHAELESGRWPVLVRGIGLSIAATIVFGALLWGITRLRRRLHYLLQRGLKNHLLRENKYRVDWIGNAYHVSRRIVQTLSVLAILTFGYLWLIAVLEFFPLTAPVGDRLGFFLLDLLGSFGKGVLSSIPDILAIALILFIARVLYQALGRLFQAVRDNKITVPGIHSDTAEATRRIVGVLIWIIALTFAYPYIPGSQSDIFKGLSVLFGFMLTLGSSGVINQWMCGAVLVYSRALRKGDVVRIGEVNGTVLKLGTLSVHLLNDRLEEITLPNALVVNNSIINYTREDMTHNPANLTAYVHCGYDVSWRQLQALLIEAADRTEGLATSPRPFVLQRSFEDFYIKYELFAQIEHPTGDPLQRARLLSDLYGNILDIFEHHNVPLMSPHLYKKVTDPDKNTSAPSHESAN